MTLVLYIAAALVIGGIGLIAIGLLINRDLRREERRMKRDDLDD